MRMSDLLWAFTGLCGTWAFGTWYLALQSWPHFI